MKNIDKIRAMSAEELGALLGKAFNQCSLCIYQDIPECSGNCKRGITRWLNAKYEKPMPELKVGDVIKTEYGEYVVIDDNKVVNPTTMKRSVFNNICVTTRFIYRYSEDEYKEIWRADNDR